MKITKIAPQAKQPDRYSIFVDDKYAFSLSQAALAEASLHSGQELSQAELQSLKQLSQTDRAYGRTLRFVSLRPRSQWEVEEYLRRKEVSPQLAQALIKRLINLGLIDDIAFARSWVEARRALKPTSARRLKLELRQKRVDSTIIDETLKTTNLNDTEALKQLVSKKRRQSKYRQDNLKLMQYLARQGFNYEDIKAAMSE